MEKKFLILLKVKREKGNRMVKRRNLKPERENGKLEEAREGERERKAQKDRNDMMRSE